MKQKWTDEDRARLLSLKDGGKSFCEIAALLGRSFASVRSAHQMLIGHKPSSHTPIHPDLKWMMEAHDMPTMLHPDTLPLDPGDPFKDNLAKCERAWAALMGGEQTRAFA